MGVLLWFRNDLRLSDHVALTKAVSSGLPIIPVFLLEEGAATTRVGAASQWWLHYSLKSLNDELEALGSRLILRRGDPAVEIPKLAMETNSVKLAFSNRYDPEGIATDEEVCALIKAEGIEVLGERGALLWEPTEIHSATGGPYQVFTPFWKKCLTSGRITDALPTPKRIPCPSNWPSSLHIEDLQLLPRVSWDSEIGQTWTPGTSGALQLLDTFVEQTWKGYTESRDQAARVGTSRLSPHLHFGEISPREVWHAVQKRAGNVRTEDRSSDPYLRQVIWREFSHHMLFHFPNTATEPLRSEFRSFPWRDDTLHLRAWQRGKTGYPWIDAGMRELWRTGWMHNRVRMAVASFLVKDLLIPWQRGADWFWDTLVDADLANNTFGWQWSAGCGADAAPFFRIFNPVLQGEKFDPQGDYVRKFIPELARLPNRWIHRPFEAPADILKSAGVSLGINYPLPIVHHPTARTAALAALKQLQVR